MRIKPLQDRIVVKRVEEETKTAGGIIIPDSHAEKPAQGEVVAVGEGYRNENGSFAALSVKVGDRVLFTKYAGSEVKLEGIEYLIMKESDVLGVLVK